jgi:thiamine monophosphate kinase
LNDGEDFELLFTLSEEDCKQLVKHWKMKTPLACIGNINDSSKIQIKMSDGEIKDLQAGGYDHLR